MQTLIQTTVVDPIQAVMVRLINVMPSVVWAIVLVGVGALLARFLRGLVERVFKLGQVDTWSDKAGLGTLLDHLGLGRSPTKLLGVLVWWFIFLVFFVGAANALQLNIVSDLLNRLALFLPQVIAAVFVLGAGILVSTVVRDIVYNACEANRVRGAATLSKLARAAVVTFAAFMALEQLGIARTVTTSTLQIVLGSFGLTFAIAFGLGGKDVATDVIKHLTRKD